MQRAAGLLLANRAYLDHGEAPGSTPALARGNEGGLLAAVRPVIAPWDGTHGTTWIGAGRGPFDRAFTDRDGYEVIPTPRGGLRHRRLFFAPDTWQGHYVAAANAFLWPLMHLVRPGLPRRTGYFPVPRTPTPTEWHAYEQVNHAFARAAIEEGGTAPCWVHDYQLALVPAILREARFGAPVGFFLHTPFPSLEVAAAEVGSRGLECLAAALRGMLGAGLAGFQSEQDVARCRAAAVALLGAEATSAGVAFEGREVLLGAYPVGIDVDELATIARTAALPAQATHVIRQGAPFVTGLERSDFTKGIPERLRAVARSYEAGVRFDYMGVAAPTRAGVPGYDEVATVIAGAAAVASVAAGDAGSHFLQLHEDMPWPQVVALQREAGVVFTSSLADGMNLVPLQAAAAQSIRPEAERGIIIAGRDSGVARTFAGGGEDGITVVDPLDDADMNRTLRAAVAGDLPPIGDRLIARLREHDAHAWATQFLGDLEGAC